jgi:ParB family transcriptional regulator, chromosome partitioning protein
MKDIVSVDPFRCRVWEFHDRLEQHVDEITCKQEIESFLRHGQLVPALGRVLRGDPDHDVELIYGARRLFVARHLNRQLRVELRQMTNGEAIAAMDIENRHRLDISPYERGRSYVKWLQYNIFKSQEDIARELKISASQVSRLIKLAQLPSVVVAAFKSPVDICETWAQDLAGILEDPKSRERTCARARSIAALSVRPEPRDILRQLLNASVPGRKVKVPQHDEVVTGRSGKPLFRIRHLANTTAFVVSSNHVTSDRLEHIRSAMANAMEEPLPTGG